MVDIENIQRFKGWIWLILLINLISRPHNYKKNTG